MRLVIALLLTPLLAAGARAQDAAAVLRVTVADPSGAVIVGAHVSLVPAAGKEAVPFFPEDAAKKGYGPFSDRDTGDRGIAVFDGIPPGRYTIHVESPGFEPQDARNVRVRAGDNAHQLKLAIAKLAETVQVGRDPRDAALDPRGGAFATVLGPDAINELPDDPDEMERVLQDMAGPGAVMRVNGFRGGKLPPKDQIAQIRFHRNMFAADTHEPGFISVDIITKPGLENWKGSTNAGFRDSALTARNAFAPVKGDERNQRYSLSLSGPVWKKHTSLALTATGVDAFDAKTIVAALPSGYLADSIRRPNGTMNLSARVEHALTPKQMLRAEVQSNHNRLDNQGVGDFDLEERAYQQTVDERLLRTSVTGALGRTAYNEFRFQWRSQQTMFTPSSQAPAALVLNAFDSGGAQLDGSQTAGEVEVADDLDISAGKHALRAGMLIDAGRYEYDVRRNGTGTFTFASLAAFAAAQPTTFTRNIGDPRVSASQVEAGIYVQDDYRVRKELTLSGGIRAETQQHIGGVHTGPRGGGAWSPFKDGKTTIRGGGGVFFDWLDAQSYEQAVQLDGTHQQIETIVQPGYPNPTGGGRALVLPSGRVALAPTLQQPVLHEATLAIDRQLPGGMRASATLVRRRGSHVLRGVNVNAPLPNGARPDPSAGTITEVESIAASSFDALFLNVNYAKPDRRIFIGANYSLSSAIDETDGPLSLPVDSRNLAAERGPAASDARHRFSSLASVPLTRSLMLGTAVRVQSALPYNITTGFDDNGDTVSNDRPAGVTRNSARGTMLVDIGARLTWTIGFGGPPRSGPEGPQINIIRGGDADPLRGMPSGDGTRSRYRLELYAQGYNLTNHVNALTFSGVETSPFFGQATSAAAPRRIEIGARLLF
jgi:hypothetical protein